MKRVLILVSMDEGDQCNGFTFVKKSCCRAVTENDTG